MLANIEDQNKNKLFGIIENRGDELFVTLTYPFEIKTDTKFNFNNTEFKNFQNEVSLVAIKNGMHSSKGFIYSSNHFKDFLFKDKNEIDIKNIKKSIVNFFKNEKTNISVVGLGYVGLPLALALGKHFKVIGYDYNKERINQLLNCIDINNDLNKKNFKSSKKNSVCIR